MSELTHAVEPDVGHDGDIGVEKVPFAYSDLIKIDVPDTIASLCPDLPVEAPAAVIVVDDAPVPTSAPTSVSVPSPKLDALALARAVEADQRQWLPESSKKCKKVRQRRSDGHDHVIHGIIAIKYGVIALVGGVVAYGVYSIISGIVGLVSSAATFASQAPAVVGGIIVLLLFARLVNGLSIFNVGQHVVSKFNGTADLQHGLRCNTVGVRTTAVVKKNKIGGIGHVSVVEQPVDELAARWVDKMRDRSTGQVQGAWRGETQNDRCAVGHLLEIADPDGWATGDSGFNHRAFWDLKRRFGKKVLKNAITMNDDGRSLPQIANYVERELHKRGQL